MGRPSLKVTKTTIRLQEGVFARIVALAGKRGMAGWIREAIAQRLERDEKPLQPKEIRENTSDT